MRILGRRFYARHPSRVARDLLGKVLVRRIGRKILSGRIVEAEAYSSDDPASHAFRGRTERNRALFGEVGRAYIYQTHGLNFCLNVTARKGKPAGGVLIRAVEPLRGAENMKKLRGRTDIRELARGPGYLGRAMAIDRRLYGTDVTKKGPLFIADDGALKPKVKRTTRIGVTAARELRRRFIVAGSPFVSGPKTSRIPSRAAKDRSSRLR